MAVDTAELAAAVADGTVERLERAQALYTGEFLAGLRVDEPPFEQWRTTERERLHELALEALARLLREHTRTGRVGAAMQAALRILAVDPLQEAVHRALMRLLLGQGRRGAALQQYQTCVSVLHQELGTEPEPETRELYRQILQARGGVSGSDTTVLSARERARPIETPMVGREKEVEYLHRSLSRVMDEGGRVVLVIGEAGIGKTRLVQEVLRGEAAAHARLLLGRCYESERSLPLRPWVDALRAERSVLVAVRDKLTASTQVRLAPVLPELSQEPRQPTEPQPALLFDPLVEVIAALASVQPLVFVMEDVHWADTMSVQFLAFLGRRISRLPVLVAATARAEELSDAPALVGALKELRDERRLDEIALDALSPAETRTLVRALRPADAEADSVAEEIWRVSEGIPLVIVESTRVAGDEVPTRYAGDGRIGPAVRELVADRLDRLSEAARRCAAVAAAIGREFSFALLTRATGIREAEAADAVEALVRRRLLDSVGDRLDFCHEWIRVATYEHVGGPKRTVLHAAIGDALEAMHADHLDDVADQLGTHYARAGAIDRAIPYLTRFGVLAAARYAFDDALMAFAQARDIVDRLPAADRDRRGLQVVLQEAFVLSVMGRQHELLGLLRKHTGAATRVNDVALLAEYYFRLGLTQFFLGDRVDAGVAADTALAYAERLNDRVGIAKALHVLSLLAYELGQPRAGIAHAHRAIALLEAAGSPLGIVAGWLGLLYQDLALNQVQAGGFTDALVAVERLEAIGGLTQFARLRAFAGYIATLIAALRGDTVKALETGRPALDVARDPMAKGLVSMALAMAQVEHDPLVAITLLTESIDSFTQHPYRHGRVKATALLAEAYLATGDLARACDIAERALALALEDGALLNTGLAQRVLGRVVGARGDLAEAQARLLESLTTFRECDAAFEIALTRASLARVLAQANDAAGACEHLQAACMIFEAAAAPRRAASATAQVHAAKPGGMPPA